MSLTQSHLYGNPPPQEDSAVAAFLKIKPAPAQDPPMINYRGVSLTQPFDLRTRIKLSREKPMHGFCICAFPHTTVGRIVGQAGYDYVFLDWEHTPMSIENLVELTKTIQSASEGKTAVLVRVPTHEHNWIAWALDAGASGIILPHCETVDQVKRSLRAARFPKYGGNRSGPPAALLFGYNDGNNIPGGGAPDGDTGCLEVWNRAAVIVQVESKLGAENAAELAAIPGVDGLMVGPGDLAYDLGVEYLKMGQDETWKAHAGMIVKAAKDANMGCLFPTMNVEMAPMLLGMGATMICCGFDSVTMVRGMRDNLAAITESITDFKTKQEEK